MNFAQVVLWKVGIKKYAWKKPQKYLKEKNEIKFQVKETEELIDSKTWIIDLKY